MSRTLRRKRIVSGLFLLPLLLVVLFFGSAAVVGTYWYVTGQIPVTSPSKTAVPSDTKVVLLAKEASTSGKEVPFLTKLEAIFMGHPSQAEIQRAMDQVLATFEQPSTNENYKILGNVLVRMRKDNPGTTEMLILRCMTSAGSLKPDFVAAAAICAVGLNR
jgi:hypothetical protein